MYQSIPKPPIPPPRAIPGHLTCVKLRTVGNLTQNACQLCSRVIALVDSTWVFSVVFVLYNYIVEYAFV